jgi:hypothetical protein
MYISVGHDERDVHDTLSAFDDAARTLANERG